MTLLHRLFPPEAPLSPMAFTRKPVMPRFWTGGLLAMGVGFVLGFLLWMQQQGEMTLWRDFADWRLIHGRVQLFLFAGSFLLGFALQAGPHVVGGSPPPSNTALALLYPLWLGFALTLLPFAPLVWLGNGAMSGAYAMAAWLVGRMAWQGDRQRLAGIGLPMALGFFFMAVGVWLPMGETSVALAMLWCGPLAIVFGASQQLLANVMGGQRLMATPGKIFFALLVLSWGLSLAAIWQPDLTRWMALGWLMVWGWFIWHTRALHIMPKQDFNSLLVTLASGFTFIALAALVLMMEQTAALDQAVHLLGAGTLTVLILGVAARVASFFSAGRLFHDRLLALFLLAWDAIALARAFHAPASHLIVALGGLLLLAWGLRLLLRLLAIRKLVPANLGGKGAGKIPIAAR